MNAPAEPEESRRNPVRALLEAWLRMPRAVRMAPPLACMAVLWWSSARVPDGGGEGVLGALLHNAMHVVAYGGLATALWLAGSGSPVVDRQPWRSRIAWGIAVLYGVVDEVHQSWVPGRVSSFGDLLSDASGAALAITALRGLLGLLRPWHGQVLAWLAISIVCVALATFVDW